MTSDGRKKDEGLELPFPSWCPACIHRNIKNKGVEKPCAFCFQDDEPSEWEDE